MDGYQPAFGDDIDPTVGARSQRGKGKRFVLTPFADIRVSTAPAYLIKGLIPRTGLVVFWGPPKCGKSFVVFDATMHIALGWEYRGRRTKQGSIVYAALEGAEGFRSRAQAFRERNDLPNDAEVHFHLISMPIALAADAKALIESIRGALGQTLPAAIVIDTLNRSLAGSESDDRDMGGYIQAADLIRDAFGCAVIVVHHCGIDATRPRGHTSLTGAADAQLSVKRDTADNIVVEVEWMKDGPAGDTLVSRLESVEVGTDDDGDRITSCVVVPVEGAAARVSKPGRRLSGAAATAIRALHEAVDENGGIPPVSPHIPRDTRCVSIDQWRDHAKRRGLSDGEPDAFRKAWRRAFDKLVADGHVAISGEWAWPIGAKAAS